MWTVSAIEYELTKKVYADENKYLFQAPDDGYNYLLIYLELTNNKNTDSSLSWYKDTFEFNINNQTYSLLGQLQSPIGYLQTAYKPNQTKSGFVIFEIPEEYTISEGELVFIPELTVKVTIKMNTLTEKEK